MRWWPTALVLVAAALWAEALVGGSLASGPGALVVMAGLGLLAGLRSTWPTALAAGVVSTGLLAVADQVADPGHFTLGNDAVFYAVVVLGPVLLAAALAARNRQVQRLLAQRSSLRRRRRRVLDAARAEESARVAAQVDRTLSASVASVVEAARKARLDDVEERSRAALAELRELLGTLHEPPAIEPASERAPRRGPDPIDLVLAPAGLPLAVETAHAGPLAVMLSMAQGLLLPFVRRRPLAGAGAVLAVAVAQTALVVPLPPTVGWLLPGLLLACLVGAAPSRRAALGGLLVVTAGAALLPLATPGRPDDGSLPGLVLVALAWIGGRTLGGRAARAEELRTIAEELLRTEDIAARAAVVELRAELARELHDVGAHTLTVAVLQAEAARTWRRRDPDRAGQALAALRRLADGPLTALSSSLAQEPDRPLLELAGDLGRVLGLQVELRLVGETRTLPDGVATAAARIVQEALTNAARHAPGGGVVVEIGYDSDRVSVRVRDAGPRDESVVAGGFGSGRGLAGMRERVTALRGELAAGPTGDGFEVLATLPAP